MKNIHEKFNPSFSKRIELNKQKIILSYNNLNSKPIITVGVPTYKRKTLERTLISLTKQNFKEFQVLISDNNGISEETINIVEKFKFSLPIVFLISQKNNIGNIGNIAFLLNCANTEFFMWLADDDEISENYIITLYNLLLKNPDAVSAMGSCKLMSSSKNGKFISQIDNANKNTIIRICNFIVGNADDTSFYGLHKTRNLRNTFFNGYFSPNKKIISNYCYLIIFDLLLQGPILSSKDAIWLCHAYSEKSYNRGDGATFRGKFIIFIRRINIYILYCFKAYGKRKFIFLLFFFHL